MKIWTILPLVVLSITICVIPAAGQTNPTIGGLTPVSAVFDGPDGFSALDGTHDVTIFEQEDRIYAMVAAWNDNGVQIIDIADPVHPTPVSAVFDDSNGFSALDRANGMEVFENGERMYAIVTAWNDNGVQIIDITDPVHPTPVSAVFDGADGFSALYGAVYAVVFENGERMYAMVAARDDNGVQIIDITDPVHPTPVSAVFDGADGFSAARRGK